MQRKISSKITHSLLPAIGIVLVLTLSLTGLGSGLAHSDLGPSAIPDIYLPVLLNDSTGPSVEVFVAAGQAAKLEMATQPFEQTTGIDIRYVEQTDVDEIIDQIKNGNIPDLALLPLPDTKGLADEGYTIDLNDWFTPSYLSGQYDQSWLDMATHNSELIGIWTQADIKSLVWYPKAKFTAAGYQVPDTWAELLALTQQIADDGTAPWCIGIESGGATGWVGTDWVEDIMLRTTSTANYDAWTEGTLAFSSPQVKSAFQTMGQIWLNDDYVYNGTAAIKGISFADAPLPMFEDPPGCFLHRQANFITIFFPGDAELGVDVDYFYLPPIDSQYGNPLLIAGSLYTVLANRPEVREFARHLTTAESVRYLVEQGDFLSPHKDVDLDWYPSDFERSYAELLANASAVRFDASDLMPGQVGFGSFWTGIVDFVDGVDLDTILATIDASWP